MQNIICIGRLYGSGGKRFEKNCNMMLSGSHFSIDGCVSLIIDCLKEKETPENE